MARLITCGDGGELVAAGTRAVPHLRPRKAVRARCTRADNTDVAERKTFEDPPSDRVVLLVRCAGSNGKCGQVQAEMLDDGKVRYTDVECHRLPDHFELRRDVILAYQQARVRWARARRSRQSFRPPSIRILPAPRYAREDRQTRETRRQLEAWLAWHDPD